MKSDPNSDVYKTKRKRFSKKNIERVKRKYENRGIIYLARIPPRMDVRICRRILSQFGEIGRIHFATEDMEEYKERRESGGYKRRGYVEGWVEFLDKSIAKKFVRRYNGQAIGGKKRSPFYEEIWSIKYLSKFKWDHLLEGIRHRKMLHQQEIEKELADAKKEQELYLNRVQAAKRIENSGEEGRRKVQKLQTQIKPIEDPVESISSQQVSDELLVLFGGRMD